LELSGFYPDFGQNGPIKSFAIVLHYGRDFFPISQKRFPVFMSIHFFSGFPIYLGQRGPSNIIAGLILTYMRLFKIGDRGNCDVVGDVIENRY
jgi:hypothetical protein